MKECLAYEGLERTICLDNNNIYIDLNCFFLLYIEETLVSVLTIYQPFDDEVEISAYTLPNQRRNGYFTCLLDYAEDELIEYDIFTYRFVIESKSVSGKQTATALNSKYVKSEYLMCLKDEGIQSLKDSDNKIIYEKGKSKCGIKLHEIRSENKEEIINLSSSIFKTDYTITQAILDDIFNSNSMVTYLAKYNNMLIGICHVSYNVRSAYLFGFGIVPSYQNKGYGKKVLQLLIDQIGIHNVNYITLQVSSDNIRAFKLYKGYGFNIQTSYDYYEYVIELED